MTNHEATVFIVDDDQAVRESLADLMDSVDIKVETFATANDFLSSYSADSIGCLILDIRMPGMSGLELQQELNRREALIPVILITGHGDVPMAVQAMRQGALDFLQKPFRDQELLDRVNHALQSSNHHSDNQQQTQSVKNHIQELTPREHQVMEMIIEGKANKVIALDLGLSQRTIEVHRANVMHKLQARSLADLVRIVTQTGLI